LTLSITTNDAIPRWICWHQPNTNNYMPPCCN